MDEVKRSLAVLESSLSHIVRRLDQFISREEVDEREADVRRVINLLGRVILAMFLFGAFVAFLAVGMVVGNVRLCHKADESKTALRNVIGLALSASPPTTVPLNDPEDQKRADAQARERTERTKEFARASAALTGPIDCSLAGSAGPFGSWRVMLALFAGLLGVAVGAYLLLVRRKMCAGKCWRKRVAARLHRKEPPSDG